MIRNNHRAVSRIQKKENHFRKLGKLPILKTFSKICKITVKAVVPEREKRESSDEEEIILLAKKGAKERNKDKNRKRGEKHGEDLEKTQKRKNTSKREKRERCPLEIR